MGEERIVEIKTEELLKIAEEFKNKGYTYFSFMTAVDEKEKFSLCYRLSSLENKNSITIKVKIPRDNPVIDSLTSLWAGANWQEREVYDLFGIIFEGHPDLRRILLPEYWEGHPLRKDYQDERITKRPDFY